MKLIDMSVNTFVRRIWDDNVYLVRRLSKYNFVFMNYHTGLENWINANEVKNDSIVWEHTDYEYCDKYGIEIDKIKIKKEPKMKREVNYIGGDYKIAMCSYKGETRQYAFKMSIDTVVPDNAICVVESSNGYDLVRIVEVLDNNIDNAEVVSKATAWVVDVIDMTTHNARIDATKKREYIIQQLEEKKKALEAVSMYQLLADLDPEAKLLVEQLKTLK